MAIRAGFVVMAPDRLESPLWKLTPTEARACLITLVLSLIARGQVFLPGFSMDDYVHVLLPEHLTFGMTASQGRPLVVPLLSTLRAFGLSPADAMPVSTLALMLALAFTGLVVCRLLGVSGRLLESTTVMSFLSLFPYQAEIFTFRTASMLMALPLAVTFWAIYSPLIRPWQWIACVSACVAALSVYQLVLNYAAMALIFVALYHVLTGSEKAIRLRLKRTALMLAVSVIVYLGVLKLGLRWGTLPNNRMGLLTGRDDLVLRAHQIGELARQIFLAAEPIMPIAAKIVLLLILAAVFYSVVADHGRASAAPKRSWRAAALSAAVLAGAAACMGMVIALPGWWPVPRVLSQTGLFWGCTLALGLLFAGPRMKSCLLLLGTVSLLSFLGINNQIVSEQLRLNRRDMDLANRILLDIEKLPGAATLRGVCIQGGAWYYASGFKTVQGDLNISALSVAWAKTYLLNEASGKRYLEPDAAALSKAAAFCATSPRWPDQGSVARLGDYGVVCLPEP